MALCTEEDFRVQFHLAGLDLGQIEHVVDELEQMAAAVKHVAQVFLLLRAAAGRAFRRSETR